jgi:hypothetical protein
MSGRWIQIRHFRGPAASQSIGWRNLAAVHSPEELTIKSDWETWTIAMFVRRILWNQSSRASKIVR